VYLFPKKENSKPIGKGPSTPSSVVATSMPMRPYVAVRVTGTPGLIVSSIPAENCATRKFESRQNRTASGILTFDV
jgi:hypothetical protein